MSLLSRRQDSALRSVLVSSFCQLKLLALAHRRLAYHILRDRQSTGLRGIVASSLSLNDWFRRVWVEAMWYEMVEVDGV